MFVPSPPILGRRLPRRPKASKNQVYLYFQFCIKWYLAFQSNKKSEYVVQVNTLDTIPNTGAEPLPHLRHHPPCEDITQRNECLIEISSLFIKILPVNFYAEKFYVSSGCILYALYMLKSALSPQKSKTILGQISLAPAI